MLFCVENSIAYKYEILPIYLVIILVHELSKASAALKTRGYWYNTKLIQK